MKKNILLGILGVLLIVNSSLLLSGCHSNTRSMGGTETIELPKGKKLEEITWKDDSLWYTTRDMRQDEKAETHEFQEDSNLGIAQGKVIIKESK